MMVAQQQQSNAVLLWLSKLDEYCSEVVFNMSLPPTLEVLLSIPGNWFGLPVSLLVTSLWIIIIAEASFLESERSGMIIPTTALMTLALLFLWLLFLQGRHSIMTRLLFSNVAFGASPMLALSLCYGLAFPTAASLSVGLYQLLLYCSSVTIILLLKHACGRKRPSVDRQNIIESRRYLRVIPNFLNKVGPYASFPSGDAMAVMTFAIPLLVQEKSPMLVALAAIMTVVLACFGRVYFLAHYISDTLAGLCVTFFSHLMWKHAIGLKMESVQYYHVIGAHMVFVSIGLLRRSNQK